MKKIVVFSTILLVALCVGFGAIAETLVDMPFRLKWTESFEFQNGVQFGMTKEEVDSHQLEDAEYHYDEAGLLSSVVFKFPLKDYNSAYSDYVDMEKQLTDEYGEPIGIELILPSKAIVDEMQVSGTGDHSSRIIIEGKNRLVTIEQYMFGEFVSKNTDYYRVVVYSMFEGKMYDSILYWHLKNQSF
jgi:hypothetical protein